MKQKRRYESPRAIADYFVTDNYCTSACYYIACEYGIKGGNNTFSSYAPWQGLNVNGVRIPADSTRNEYHTKLNNHTGCGWADNQVVTVEGNCVTAINEINADGKKSYTGQILTQQGNTVYWTTIGGDNNDRVWSHKGTIETKAANHPNMS